jgi:ACS family tartrate transporter-like MFS transporter
MNMTELSVPALDRARQKAYWRLLPLLFLCYVIAYVDRANVAIAKLTMTRDLPGFDNHVIGLGAGLFFIGYFLLEIPGTLLVEKWSARKWICRIMVTWGVMATLTAFVKTLFHLYVVRFCSVCRKRDFSGSHCVSRIGFPAGIARERWPALVATPIAQIISPKISNAPLKIEPTNNQRAVVHRPELFGLEGWQCVYIFWGIPAVLLGIVVFALEGPTADARWLTRERGSGPGTRTREDQQRASHDGAEALRHPKVLLLALAYLCIVTGSQGRIFLPSILQQWYHLKLDAITWLVILPPVLALAGQIFVGWN